MAGPITLVVFVMLAAMLIVALGPILGVTAWLACLAIFLSVIKRLRRHVWDQSRPNQ